jgi:hypothetical protein
MSTELERIRALEVRVQTVEDDVKEVRRQLTWLNRFTFAVLSSVIINIILVLSGLHL